MAFYGISAASGGHLNFDNGYRGLQISSSGFLSLSRQFNLIRFEQPTWCKEVGLLKTIDCGTGTQIQLIWNNALSSSPERTLAYNIYYATKRADVFREDPKLITDNTNVVINGFTPGDQMYFGVRATDYPPVFEVTNLSQVGENLYLPSGDKGNEECNFNIGLATPYYDFPNEPAGGRITPESTVVTPGDSRDDGINFRPYDFCGWHSQRPESFFTGQCLNSYAGGEQKRQDAEGNAVSVRGLNAGERNAQRLEFLLQQTGEPIVLFRRKWDGRRCPCVRSRHESPRQRCGDCFGTGFTGGYDQFISPRRTDSKILMRFSPFIEDLKLDKDGALMQEVRPETWTLPFPMIRDRDLIVRYDAKDASKEVWRYEVLSVTRNRVIFGSNFGAQKMTIMRQDRTDPVYRVPVVLP